MLAFLGVMMVVTFTYLIMTKRLSPVVSLIAVPLLFALASGFAGTTDKMMLDGLKMVAPSAALLLFAMLFFGVMFDTGLFDPLIKFILHQVKGDPVKVSIGTAIMALCVGLDGDGTTTYMIVGSAMLPLYKRIGMNPMILAALCVLSVSAIGGMTPWGGPATRAIAVLGLDASDFLVPLMPTLAAGAFGVLYIAYRLGKRERTRIGVVDLVSGGDGCYIESIVAHGDNKRPHLAWLNFILVLAVLSSLILGLLSSVVTFTLGFVLAVSINYRDLKVQKERIQAHAGNALSVVVLVFAAGVFAGIFSGTKMVDAISNMLVNAIPHSWGHLFPLVVAITSMPLTFLLSSDAYYFGVIPILAHAAAEFGISPVEIARASVMGQPVHMISPLLASTLLLVGMIDRELGDFQKFTILWAIGLSLFMTVAALLTGAFSLFH